MPFWTVPSGAARPRQKLMAMHGLDAATYPAPHVLASPPGTRAPIDRINYTPSTGEIAPPGVLAPIDALNYSLMPHDDYGAAVQPSSGIGSGADSIWGSQPPRSITSPGAPPGGDTMGRYDPSQSMSGNTFSPGQPPINPYPYGAGPGPRSQASGPAPRDFAQRGSTTGNLDSDNLFGAGADDDENDDKLSPGGLSGGGAQTTAPSSVHQTGTTGDVQLVPAAGETPSPDTTAAQTASPTGIQVVTKSTVNGQAVPKPTAQSNDLTYWVFANGKKLLVYSSGPGDFDPSTGKKTQHQVPQTVQQQDPESSNYNPKAGQGTTPRPPQETRSIYDPSDGVWKDYRVTYDDQGNITQKTLVGPSKDQGKAGTQPQGAGQVRTDAQTGVVQVKQPDGTWRTDNEATKALAAGKQATADAKAKSDQAIASGHDAADLDRALATATPMQLHDNKDGTYDIWDARTGEVISHNGKVDPSTKRITVGNAVYQIDDSDPNNQKFNKIFQAPNNYVVRTDGGRTYGYDPQDPTKQVDLYNDPNFAEKQGLDLQKARQDLLKTQQDLITGRITAAEAKIKLAQSADEMMHPKPILTATDILTPPGGDTYIEQPGGGYQHVSGGPLPASTQKLYQQIQDTISGLDLGKTAADTTGGTDTTTKPKADQAQSGATVSQAGGTTTVASGATNDTGNALANNAAVTSIDQQQSNTNTLLPGQAGVRGIDYEHAGLALPGIAGTPRDPRYTTTGTVPPTKVTQADGSTIVTDPTVGSTLQSGIQRDDDNQTDDEYDFGTGQDTFDGRGLTPQQGRGSTGAGWDPQMGAGAAGGFRFNPSRSLMASMPRMSVGRRPTRMRRPTLSSMGGGMLTGVGADSDTPGWSPPPQHDDWARPADENMPSPTQIKPSYPVAGAPQLDDPKKLVPQLDGGKVYPWTPDEHTPTKPPRINSDPSWGDVQGPPSVDTTHSRYTDPWIEEGGDIDPFVPNSMPNYVPQRNLNGPIPIGTGADDGSQPQQTSAPASSGTSTPPAGGGGAASTSSSASGVESDPLYQFAMAQRSGVGTSPTPSAGGATAAMGAPPPSGGMPSQPGQQPGWAPPVPPDQVAGIGHRFGQQMNQGEPFHSGIDLQAVDGSDTISPVDGMVQSVENNPDGLGLTVIIQGNDGTVHKLGHLKDTEAYRGMQVAQGQNLARVGSSGNTTGSHLHWSVRDGQSGQPLDPTAAMGDQAMMPPVPGTQMMGPPGGSGGAAQMVGSAGSGPPPVPQPPQMGGGQDIGAGAGDPADLQNTTMYRPYWEQTPMAARKNLARSGGWNPKDSGAGLLGQPPIQEFEINPDVLGTGADDNSDQYTMYHGTPADFPKMDPDKVRAGENLYGPGVYLSESPVVTGGNVNPMPGEAGYDQSQLPGYVDYPQGYAVKGVKSSQLNQLQYELDTQEKLLNYYKGAPDDLFLSHNQRKEDVVNNAQANLDWTRSQLEQVMGGAQPNVRKIGVPKSLNLIDFEQPAPPDLVQKLEDLHPGILANYDSSSQPLKQAYEDMVQYVAAGGGSYADAQRMLNQDLAYLGYDGIAHQGGGSPGNPGHQVRIIFPESIDKIQNQISGTMGGSSQIDPSLTGGNLDQGQDWVPIESTGEHTPGQEMTLPDQNVNTGPGPGPTGHTPGPGIKLPDVLDMGKPGSGLRLPGMPAFAGAGADSFDEWEAKKEQQADKMYGGWPDPNRTAYPRAWDPTDAPPKIKMPVPQTGAGADESPDQGDAGGNSVWDMLTKRQPGAPQGGIDQDALLEWLADALDKDKALQEQGHEMADSTIMKGELPRTPQDLIKFNEEAGHGLYSQVAPKAYRDLPVIGGVTGGFFEPAAAPGIGVGDIALSGVSKRLAESGGGVAMKLVAKLVDRGVAPEMAQQMVERALSGKLPELLTGSGLMEQGVKPAVNAVGVPKALAAPETGPAELAGIGGGQDSADARWDLLEAKDKGQFMGPQSPAPIQYGGAQQGTDEYGIGSGADDYDPRQGPVDWVGIPHYTPEEMPDFAAGNSERPWQDTQKWIRQRLKILNQQDPYGAGTEGDDGWDPYSKQYVGAGAEPVDPWMQARRDAVVGSNLKSDISHKLLGEGWTIDSMGNLQPPPNPNGPQGFGVGAGGEGGMGAGGRYVNGKWDESQPSLSSDDQNQGNNIPAYSPGQTSSGGGGGGGGGGQPSSGGGGNTVNTPNGPKTIDQINKELAAAGWDGKGGDAVTVYNRVAGAAVSGNNNGTVDPNTGTRDNVNAGTLATIAQQDRQLAEKAQNDQANIANARQQEEDRHNEVMANLQQQAAFHADDVRLQEAINAENNRHNQAMEGLQAQSIQMQQTIESMREANAIELEKMGEANRIQMQQMQEGTQIYLQQGQQAFADWQANQKARMDILASALNNPWLQKLSGMTPGANYNAPAVGGQNIANLVNNILKPYDPNAWGVANAPSVMGLGGSTAGGAAPGATGSQPTLPQQSSTGANATAAPNWQTWSSWDPFQKAAYRADQEALGPGAWNAVGDALATQFANQGGNPNVTQMQAAASGDVGRAGMEMTADLFGQPAQNFWQNQGRQWSAAQAPNVKQAVAPSGIAS